MEAAEHGYDGVSEIETRPPAARQIQHMTDDTADEMNRLPDGDRTEVPA